MASPKPSCLCRICKKCKKREYMKKYLKDPINLKKAKLRELNYRISHREEARLRTKKWTKIPENYERKIKYDKNYKKQDGYKEKYNAYKKEWNKKNPNYKKEEYKRNYETYRKYQQKIKEKYWSDLKFRALIKKSSHDYYHYRGGRQVMQAYYKKNPRMVGHSYPRDMFWAMYEARVRDRNKCQWYGCGKTASNTHHIFSVAKYPELRNEKWNLISYCSEHHAEFHEAKGENSEAGLIRGQAKAKAKKTISHSLNHHSLT